MRLEGNLTVLEKTKKSTKSGLKRSIKLNNYQTKVSTEVLNWYLDFLIDPRLERVNRLSVLSFENEGNRKVQTGYYLRKVEIINYNDMIDAKNLCDQLLKNFYSKNFNWLRKWLCNRLFTRL